MLVSGIILPSLAATSNLELFSLLPNLINITIPLHKWPADGLQSLRSMKEPMLLEGIQTESNASEWEAWHAWEPEALHGVHDYFNPVELHLGPEGGPPSSWTTYLPADLAFADDLGLQEKYLTGGSVYELVEHVMLKDLIDGCKQGKLYYIGGGAHPEFLKHIHPAMEPENWGSFGFDNRTEPGLNMYWACRGVADFLHFDQQSVVMVQVTGEKDVLIWPPDFHGVVANFPNTHPGFRHTQMRLSPNGKALDPEQWPRLQDMKDFRHVRMRPGMALLVPAYWYHTISIPNLRLDGSANPISTAVSIKDTTDLLPFEHGIDHVGITDRFRDLTQLVVRKLKFDEKFKPGLARYICEALLFALLDGPTPKRMGYLLQTLAYRYSPIASHFETKPASAYECSALKLSGKQLKKAKVYSTVLRKKKEFSSAWHGIEQGIAEIEILKNIEWVAMDVVGGKNVWSLFTAFVGDCATPIYEWEFPANKDEL